NFISLNDCLRDYLTMDDFRESYPRHPSIEVNIKKKLLAHNPCEV
ncbi:unnamed protein product, partial [Rotaria sp. Silwood1]